MTYLVSFKFLIPLTVIMFVLVSYNFLSAQWAGPTAVPPNNNTAAPINISSTYQAKLGDLGAIRMRAGQYCDEAGLNCYTTSEMVGGGATAVTQLLSGAGITLSPGTITSTGTVAIDPNYTQRRIATTCPAGQSIRQINADGTIVCQDVTPTCWLEGVSFAAGARCRVDTGSCGSGTTYSSLNCMSDGNWTTGSFCTVSTPPAMAYCP